jgi:glutathione S-transferase
VQRRPGACVPREGVPPLWPWVEALRGVVGARGIEASYLALLSDLDTHFAARPFLLGTRPSIGDFALLLPLYAHLYRDPLSGRILRERAPRVADWVELMNAPEPRSGRFASKDEVAATLAPVLRRMFEEQGPVLVSTLERLEA